MTGTASSSGSRTARRWLRLLAALPLVALLPACNLAGVIDSQARVGQQGRFTLVENRSRHAAAAQGPVRQRPRQQAVRPASTQPPAAEPAGADPSARMAGLLQEKPWLAQFWEELSPAERARVGEGLRAAAPPVPPPGHPVAWDRMGLTDRARLVQGAGI